MVHDAVYSTHALVRPKNVQHTYVVCTSRQRECVSTQHADRERHEFRFFWCVCARSSQCCAMMRMPIFDGGTFHSLRLHNAKEKYTHTQLIIIQAANEHKGASGSITNCAQYVYMYVYNIMRAI